MDAASIGKMVRDAAAINRLADAVHSGAGRIAMAIDPPILAMPGPETRSEVEREG